MIRWEADRVRLYFFLRRHIQRFTRREAWRLSGDPLAMWALTDGMRALVDGKVEEAGIQATVFGERLHTLAIGRSNDAKSR
jgi:hypothetical protein